MLADLLRFDGGSRSRQFLDNIHVYNSMFAFTSMGANIDKHINSGGGPYVFKICGQVHHRIGPLLPNQGLPPKFCEPYIHDTCNEVDNRLKAIVPECGDDGSGIVPEIVAGLTNMLDEVNPLVQEFRVARDRLAEHGDERVGIRIVGATKDDPMQFNMLTVRELAGLIVGDFSLENYKRDIIVDSKNKGLHHVSSLHPAYMALQYPLLFPYGERGFQLGIWHDGVDRSCDEGRTKVSMQEYYCYCCHYRPNQYNPYVCCGRLSSQSQADCFACVEESRLDYIAEHQQELRADYLQGVADAVGKGCVDGASVGKKRIVPSIFIGGRRYCVQNFQDAVAICRVFGSPHLFVTFMCSPKWPEIKEALALGPGQKYTDRSDLICRVLKLKLQDFVTSIAAGEVFGPVCAMLESIEYQKRGLPHVHMLIWLDGKSGNPVVELADSFISAEIPDLAVDLLGCVLVISVHFTHI